MNSRLEDKNQFAFDVLNSVPILGPTLKAVVRNSKDIKSDFLQQNILDYRNYYNHYINSSASRTEVLSSLYDAMSNDENFARVMGETFAVDVFGAPFSAKH